MSNRTHEMFLVAQRFNIETPQDLERALEQARDVGALDAWAGLVDLEERGCPGHDEGHGETEYCDGSCRTHASLKRFARKHWWVEEATTANGLTGLTVATDHGDEFPVVVEDATPAAARAAALKAIAALAADYARAIR